jgi:hypothetical protein
MRYIGGMPIPFFEMNRSRHYPERDMLHPFLLDVFVRDAEQGNP